MLKLKGGKDSGFFFLKIEKKERSNHPWSSQYWRRTLHPSFLYSEGLGYSQGIPWTWKCAGSAFHSLLIFPFYYKELKCVYSGSWRLSWLRGCLDAAFLHPTKAAVLAAWREQLPTGAEQGWRCWGSAPAPWAVAGMPRDGCQSQKVGWELWSLSCYSYKCLLDNVRSTHSLSISSLEYFCLDYFFTQR